MRRFVMSEAQSSYRLMFYVALLSQLLAVHVDGRRFSSEELTDPLFYGDCEKCAGLFKQKPRYACACGFLTTRQRSEVSSDLTPPFCPCTQRFPAGVGRCRKEPGPCVLGRL
jgi:hypothetical protein